MYDSRMHCYIITQLELLPKGLLIIFIFFQILKIKYVTVLFMLNAVVVNLRVDFPYGIENCYKHEDIVSHLFWTFR